MFGFEPASSAGGVESKETTMSDRAARTNTIRRSSARAAAEDLHALAHAMILQARMLKAEGDLDDARALAGRARAINHLGLSYAA